MIKVKDTLSCSEFVYDYVHKSVPVILNDVTKDWPALTKWSPANLKEKYQDIMVQITSGRNSAANCDLNILNYRSDIKFSDYVNIINCYEGNNFYLVANNRFLDTGEGGELLGDFSRNGTYLNPGPPHSENTRFWMGPKGSFTALHRDEMDVFVAQIFGRKRIAMFPPDQRHLLYNRSSVFSDVDFQNPDLSKYPLFDRTTRVEFTLHAGQALFIPVGWFHFVKSLDVSISLTLLSVLHEVPVALPAPGTTPPAPMMPALDLDSVVARQYSSRGSWLNAMAEQQRHDRAAGYSNVSQR